MNDNAKAWVEALRSGKYKQGLGYLKRKANDGEFRYCCLGVACDLYSRTGKPLPEKEVREVSCVFYAGLATVLPNEVQNWLGLTGKLGRFADGTLAALNDDGSTFEEIADVIESEPAGLFRQQKVQQKKDIIMAKSRIQVLQEMADRLRDTAWNIESRDYVSDTEQEKADIYNEAAVLLYDVIDKLSEAA